MKYLIDFKNDTDAAVIDSYLQSLSADNVTVFSNFEKTFLVEVSTEPVLTEFIDTIVNDLSTPISLLEYEKVLNDFSAEPQTSIDTTAPDNWWKIAVIKSPDFDATHNTHIVRGSSVNVYILDSGINAAHPEFNGANISNVFSITGEYSDNRGHGTALASVISGNTCGLTNANLCIVKIFDNNVSTYQSDLIAAFDAVIADFNAKGKPVSIVNLSWSIAKNDFIEGKIQSMIDAGIFVVCAAGNSGIPIENVTPASMASVITVGSFNANLVPSDFSNFSNQPISLTPGQVNTGQLDGWAPGENIRTAQIDGSYANASGTSISSAIHCGAIAYNAVAHFDDSDKLPPCVSMTRAGDAQWARHVSFGKKNILALTGDYIASANRVSTYATIAGVLPLDSGMRLKLTSGQVVCRKIFFSPVASVKILNADGLPFGLTFQGSYLLGTLPDIATDVENHELFCDVVTSTGDTIPFTIFLGVVNRNLDLNTVVPGENPELDFTLLLPVCCGPVVHNPTEDACMGSTYPCNADLPDDPCYNEIGGVGPCYRNPKDPSCRCN